MELWQACLEFEVKLIYLTWANKRVYDHNDKKSAYLYHKQVLTILEFQMSYNFKTWLLWSDFYVYMKAFVK